MHVYQTLTEHSASVSALSSTGTQRRTGGDEGETWRGRCGEGRV